MVNYYKFINTKFVFFLLIGGVLLGTNYLNIRDITIRFYSYFISYEDHLFLKNIDLINDIAITNSKTKSTEYLFIGDSHFVNLLSQNSLPLDYRSISLSGETTISILNRFDINIKNLSYRKACILLGYNDLKCRDVISTLKNLNKLINKLECDSIYVVSLLPVEKNRSIITKKIKKINLYLRVFITTNKARFKIQYIDAYSLLLNRLHNSINREFTTDGVHLNQKGNKVLINCLLNAISKSKSDNQIIYNKINQLKINDL